MAIDMNKDTSKEEFDANKDGYVLVDGNDINGKHFVLKDNLQGLDSSSDVNALVYVTVTVPDLDKYGNQKYVYKENIYETDSKGNVVKDKDGNPIVKYKKGSPCYLTDADGNMLLDEQGHPIYNTDKNLSKAATKDVVKTDENGNPVVASYSERFKGKLAKEFVTSIGTMPYTIALDSVYDGFVGIAVRDSFVHAIRDSYFYLLDKRAKDGKIICDVILSLQDKEMSKADISLVPEVNAPATNLNLNSVDIPNCNLISLNFEPKYLKLGRNFVENNDITFLQKGKDTTKRFFKFDKTGRYSLAENVLGSIKLDLNLGAVGVVPGLNKLLEAYNADRTRKYILGKLKFHTYSEGLGLNGLSQGAKNYVKFDKDDRTLNFTMCLVDNHGAIDFNVRDAQPMKAYEFNIVEYHEPNAKLSVKTKLGGETNPQNYQFNGYLGINQTLSVRVRPSFYDSDSLPTLTTKFSMVSPVDDSIQSQNLSTIQTKFDSAQDDILKDQHSRPDINFSLSHGSDQDDLLRVIPPDLTIKDISFTVENVANQANSALANNSYKGMKFESAIALNTEIEYGLENNESSL